MMELWRDGAVYENIIVNMFLIYRTVIKCASHAIGQNNL